MPTNFVSLALTSNTPMGIARTPPAPPPPSPLGLVSPMPPVPAPAPKPYATRDAVTASSRDACHLYVAGRLLFWGGAVLQRCVKRENHHSRREDRLWLRCRSRNRWHGRYQAQR